MSTKINSMVRFAGSNAVTVTLLLLLIILTVMGTIAQANVGLYRATQKYFHSMVFFFYAGPLPIPFPGAYSILCALFVNIIAAFTTRFHWRWSAMGMILCHAGILILLAGSFITHHFSQEGHIFLYEGEEVGEFMSPLHYELLVIATTDPTKNHIVSFPEKLLQKQSPLTSSLPFSIVLERYHTNCRPSIMTWESPPLWKKKSTNRLHGRSQATSYLRRAAWHPANSTLCLPAREVLLP